MAAAAGTISDTLDSGAAQAAPARKRWRKRAALLAVAALLVVGGVAAAVTMLAGQPWERLPDMPHAGIEPGATVFSGKLIVTGGIGPVGVSTDFVQVFDLSKQTWTTGQLKLLEPRHRHGQITLDDGRTLIVGGGQLKPGQKRSALRSCEIIDRGVTKVEPAEPLPVAMATPRLHMLPDGRVLAIGAATAAIYDPVIDGWVTPIALRRRREGHATCVLRDGRILVVAGSRSRDMEVVDVPAGSSKLLTARLEYMIDDHAVLPLPDGGAWVVGGQRQDGGDTLNLSWRIAFTDEGTRITDGPAPGVKDGVSDQQVLPVGGGRWVLIGGESQKSKKDTELHAVLIADTRALTIRPGPTLPLAFDDFAAVQTDDAIIVLGGQVSGPTIGGKTLPVPMKYVYQLPRSALGAALSQND